MKFTFALVLLLVSGAAPAHFAGRPRVRASHSADSSRDDDRFFPDSADRDTTAFDHHYRLQENMETDLAAGTADKLHPTSDASEESFSDSEESDKYTSESDSADRPDSPDSADPDTTDYHSRLQENMETDLAAGTAVEVTYVNEGPGKCVSSDGSSLSHKYRHGVGAVRCKSSCDKRSDCFGYSVSRHGNCLLWLEVNIVGGGSAWGSADCMIKTEPNCETINFSTDGKCGKSFGDAVCSGKEWLFCSNDGECGDTDDHKTQKTDYDFPSKCAAWLIKDEDCEMSEWSGSCSVKCGKGTKKMTRKVMKPARNGGEACPTQLEKTETCDKPKCKVCRGNHETFDAGYGGCEYYDLKSGLANHYYCPYDKQNGLAASDVCEECGLCKIDETTQITEHAEVSVSRRKERKGKEEWEEKVAVSKLLMEQNKRLKELLLALN